MELKPIVRQDLEFIRCLRNLYREWFFDDKIITENEQNDWFDNYVRNNYLIFYVVWDNGERVGAMSLRKHSPESLVNPLTKEQFDLDDASKKIDCFIEISNLMTHPNLQRKGIMYNAVMEAMGKPCNYVAFVKSHNIKSANLFRKLGFKESLKDGWIFFQSSAVILPRNEGQ